MQHLGACKPCPVSALLLPLAFSPPMETFKCGRDFAAWLGLVPRQKSSGGIGTSV
ncbi:MAG: IS110 family transposase, partial [Mesorhizobium sp.]